jgi:hypothetical protein
MGGVRMNGAKDNAGKKPLTSNEKRARDKARRAERKARLKEREETWSAQVVAHFSFLETTYGFHFASVDGSSWWQTTVRYDSPPLAVRIDKSVEFERVEVWLIRLVDGQLPEYPIFVNPDTPIDYVILDRVLQNRAPQETERLLELKGLSDEQVERSLVFLSEMLRTYCDDVLRGDFAIFEVIAEQIHQETREHPQGIRIIVPDTTPQEEALARVEESQRAFPQQPVTLEYYTTKKRRPRRKDKNDNNQGNATP